MSIRLPFATRRCVPWLASLALFSLAAPAARAQRSTPAPPVDADAVLAALKDLKAKQTPLMNREKQEVMGAIAAALADPARAYEQATVAVEFQGQSNDGTKIGEWRKKTGDLLRNPVFVDGLHLQLAYISLTWQRSMGARNKDLLPTLYEYTAQVTKNTDALAPFEVLHKPLGESVFVRYFQIGPYISEIKDWSDHPLDADSIYQKAILPTLREMKDPRVLDYWIAKIQLEAVRVDKTNNNLAVRKFNNDRKPELLWSRAEDEEAIGQHNQAVADMLALAKAHPDHPDFDKWAARLTDLVKPAKAEVVVHDAPDVPAPAPAPVASPGSR